MVVMLLTFIFIINSIPPPPHSFIPGLTPSFSANPSQRRLPFPLQDWHHRFPRLFTSVWCPYKIGDSKEIEKIQKRATKLVIKLKNKSYIDRLIYLNLPTLKYRRLRGDIIEVFKITDNIYDRTVSPDLPINKRANTRGNHYKLQNHTFHYDL